MIDDEGPDVYDPELSNEWHDVGGEFGAGFCLLAVIAIGFFAWLGIGLAKGSVQSDAYPAGHWATLQDYQDRILTVDLDATACSNGVIYLGNHRYSVPVGIERFYIREA